MFSVLSITLLIAIAMSILRLVLGPTVSDRVIAFDVIGIMAISLLVILALYFERMLYLDIALVFGLIGFLGTTIFGRFIENGI
ncbi:MAG: multicomponent Na+:H+ antiporter subunit F [Sulfurimonas sp.]|uniref:monovalent cation/H+ antiporter complex subunit F n=1 Tax=Sulfurimonas sp. TaxID=2022749 RepID=UPI0039E64F81